MWRDDVQRKKDRKRDADKRSKLVCASLAHDEVKESSKHVIVSVRPSCSTSLPLKLPQSPSAHGEQPTTESAI